MNSSDSVPSESSDSGWQEVGKGNRLVLVTVELDMEVSPVSLLFAGRQRIVLKRQGQQDTVSYQPFFILPLEVGPGDGPQSLQQSLSSYFARGEISGYRSLVTNMEIAASHTTSLDRLPPILVLHLKRFKFEARSGAEKISSALKYPLELELDPRYLYGNQTKPRYLLRAVIVHHGNSSQRGHYTSFIRTEPPGSSSSLWIHCDDDALKLVSVDVALQQVAYMLFYEQL